MKIEKISIKEVIPYENNAKLHPKEQIEQIKKSIKEFGNNDPIAIDENNVIIEGHGRLLALKELGYEEVEVIRLNHLSDEQKKAYMLAHNKLTMNSGFDFDILKEELSNIVNFDMTDFGFDLNIDLGLEDDEEDIVDETYTNKVNIPQYEITGECPSIDELVDIEKFKELVEKIEHSSVTHEQKEFLLKAAARHYAFNYSKIAEYYAHQNKEMQELMEQSALVIIDIDDAIANGYVRLSKNIEKIMGESEKNTYEG